MVSRAVKRRRTRAMPAPATQPRIGDVITVVGPACQARPLTQPQAGRPSSAELRANTQHILTMIHECRPKNTASAYEPKQEELREFC
ncbi:hypothetical protein C8A03DRAFT_38971 [Achaetomium macrosporum]|uniref:Uncharacterized protein n=1 Tax=Achaetomium macrosporum TaxID=79813 RepID=A0AAN7H6S6_9PEZI|nr:hypothetical protein C8A03DRAFT_38971 [Achaetomium macrosporum]